VYILDTNVLRAIFQHKGQQPHLETRIKQTPYEDLYISIVSVEEVLRGTLELFRNHEKKGLLANAYAFIDGLLMDLDQFQILSFNLEADEIYKRMSSEAKRHGRGDCRIAASAIAHGYTVVTRNEEDFRSIGANFENWFVV
jgi:predicted nucleic acid-binding protein